MIRLTEKGGGTILIPENVAIRARKNYTSEIMDEVEKFEWETVVYWGDTFFVVTESPSEVARKVLEYKLEMERYKAAMVVGLENHPIVSPDPIIDNALTRLKSLAGLEDTNDA